MNFVIVMTFILMSVGQLFAQTSRSDLDKAFDYSFKNIIFKNMKISKNTKDGCYFDVQSKDKKFRVALGELFRGVKSGYRILEEDKKILFFSGAYSFTELGKIFFAKRLQGLVRYTKEQPELIFTKSSNPKKSELTNNFDISKIEDVGQFTTKLMTVINYCKDDFESKSLSKEADNSLCNIISDPESINFEKEDFVERIKQLELDGKLKFKFNKIYPRVLCQTNSAFHGISLIKNAGLNPKLSSVEIVRYLINDLKVNPNTNSFRGLSTSFETDLDFLIKEFNKLKKIKENRNNFEIDKRLKHLKEIINIVKNGKIKAFTSLELNNAQRNL